MEEVIIKERDFGGDGVLRFVCRHCEKTFKYKRGRIKNPSPRDIDKWMAVAVCPYCHKKIRD